MDKYYGHDRRNLYYLGMKLGSGGEGDVYEIKGEPNLVAKLYSSKKFTPTNVISNPRQYLKEKIETMIMQPVDTYIDGVLTIAWPQDILFDQSGLFVGYTMPKVIEAYPIFMACRRRERAHLFPDYTWKTAIAIAYNLSLAVNKIHSTGAVIGDFNQNNILVNKSGHICLIDTDSYTITNKKTGKVYKCMVGVGEVLAPELQGRDLSDEGSVFTKESDSFSLAIHVFNLLINNCHPFGCLNMNEPKGSRSMNPIVSNIAKGYCPYITGASKDKLSVDAPDMKIIPYNVHHLWERTFKYNTFNALHRDVIRVRPTAYEWQAELIKLYESKMVECKNSKSHVYPEGYDHCPWCELEKNLRKAFSTQSNIPVNPVKKINKPGNSPVMTGGGAKTVQVKTTTPPVPTMPSPTARPARRGKLPLWIVCMTVGGSTSPLLLADLLSMAVDYFFGTYLVLDTAYIVLVIAGLISGGIIAFLTQEKYMSYYKGWPWMSVSLLTPVGAAVVSALTMLAIGLLMLAISLILGILGIALAIGIIAAFVSGT